MDVPLFSCRVEAGFPSPANDHLDHLLDLHAYLVPRPASTFFVRVGGHSMMQAGIFDGDILVVDRSLDVRNRDVVIALVHGDMTAKYYRCDGGRIRLEAAHPHYEPLDLRDVEDIQIWGVVTHAIRHLR